MEGAVWICELPTVFGGCGRWAALGIVELLFNGTPGWFCVDGGADRVTDISVPSNDVVESDVRPSFPRDFLALSGRAELESDSWLKPEYVRSTEPSGVGCGLRLTC